MPLQITEEKNTYMSVAANARLPRAIASNCAETAQDEEHLLPFPSFVTGPGGRCGGRGYICARGGG